MPDDQRWPYSTAITSFQEVEAKVQQQKMEIERNLMLWKKADQKSLYITRFLQAIFASYRKI